MLTCLVPPTRVADHFAVLCVGLFILAAPARAAPDGTDRMAEMLDRIVRETVIEENPYLNIRRLAAIQASRPANAPFADATEEARFLLSLGREAVRAGESELAIESLERLLELTQNGAMLSRNEVNEARTWLGISYLRLAEEQNCDMNPSMDRCLLPFRGGGIHRKAFGGENALRVYLDLMKDYPGDLEFRWLANLAAQALGRHPEAVPEALRIPVAAYEAGADFPRFWDIAPELGLDTRSLAGGVIAEDFDLDGDLDLVVSSWGIDHPLKIFWNDGGSFRDGSERARFGGITGGLNLVQGDANNDGLQDILVLRGAWMREQGKYPNSLLRNLGDGRFVDVTEESGLLSFHPTQTAAWSDFDGDGDLDLFVGNETVSPHLHPSELWRNRGDGTFEEVSSEVGIYCEVYAKGVLWEDIDNDGRPDLYVSDLNGPNHLYRNLGPRPDGGWAFEEIGVAAGVGNPRISFPAVFFDYDQDGWPDLWVSGYRAMAAEVAAEYLGMSIEKGLLPRLYRNLGGARFEDVTEATEMDTVLATMGVGLGDLENDGFLDIYASTGNTPLETIMPNRMLRNTGEGRFEDVTVAGGFGHLQKGHAVAFADFDQDGDQDVYAVIGGAHPADIFWSVLYENPGFGNSWVRLELEGVRSNRFAVGARVSIRVRGSKGERTLWRTVGVGGSFGANPMRLEVGLADASEIVEVKVRWPRLHEGAKVEEIFVGAEVNSSWKLVEGSGVVERLKRPPIPFKKKAPAPHTEH